MKRTPINLMSGILIFCLNFLTFSSFSQTNAGKAVSPKAVAKGESLFDALCSSCHNFSQRVIGPELGTVMSAAPADWIKNMIVNAGALIEKGDPRAKELYEDYKQIMPSFQYLKKSEVDALISYIGSKQKKSAPTIPSSDGIAPLTDPIPTKIAKSPITLDLSYVSTSPLTATKAPLSRINVSRTLPGTPNRLFIQDLRGFLYEFKNNKWEVAIDLIREKPAFIHAPGLATGFGSFAFHPDFKSNGLLYTTHTEPPATAKADFAFEDSIKVTLQWVLTEWKIQDVNSLPFKVTNRTLLRINVATPIHGVQECTFNTTAVKGSADYGMLYVGVGDGGAAGEGWTHVTTGNNRIWGSVIRIDPLGKNSKNGQYGIPADNPFAKSKDADLCKEIYCRGFRNPNRIIWTPKGKMLITDIGQSHSEELNLGIPGGNYGWPDREGTFLVRPKAKIDQVFPLPAGGDPIPYLYPVAHFDHDEGKAISGGFVYTGQKIPVLQGKYIFSDVTNGRFFVVEADKLKLGTQSTITEFGLTLDKQPFSFLSIHPKYKPDVRLGLDENDELLIFTKADGKVYRVVGAQ
ncbi:MAG: PQQ-dependent sugar dehydrogenase [Bacteroidota bacterium]